MLNIEHLVTGRYHIHFNIVNCSSKEYLKRLLKHVYKPMYNKKHVVEPRL